MSATALLASATYVGAQTDDQQLALKFYPKALDDDFIANHAPDIPVTRLVTPVRVDLDGTGTDDYLAVAYSNGLSGSLRLIKGSSASAILVAESSDPTMGGRGKPVLDLVDINNDGVPELVVHFARATWIYRYKNGSLSLFGPTRQVPTGTTSNLGDVAFADLDGDGVLEILESAPPGSASPYIVYKSDASGNFVRSTTQVVIADRFVRAEGQPIVEERVFAATLGDGYILKVVNGDQTKKSVVTAGEIRLNGVTVFGNNDFKKASRTLSASVTLQARNVLTVEVRGDPQSVLSLSISRGQ
jgi:hypothetical protein